MFSRPELPANCVFGRLRRVGGPDQVAGLRDVAVQLRDEDGPADREVDQALVEDAPLVLA